MNEFHVDRAAEFALTSGEISVHSSPEDGESDLESIKHRVMEIPFDCTPNWGVIGTQSANNGWKHNWYTRDRRVRKRAEERIDNIDFGLLDNFVTDATKNLTSPEAEVAGFGIYGSYLYREAIHPPDDLDILVIAKGVQGVVLDSLRYRNDQLQKIFLDKALTVPRTKEMGLTIISEEQFHPKNRSYIVTDAALLDTSTTYSHNIQVQAPRLSPFVITLNALKLVHWGLSTLPVAPISTTSRIDEAIRMREMVIDENPQLGLRPFDVMDYIPDSSRRMVTGLEEEELLGISKIMIRLLENDERHIREYTAEKLRAA
jgi:predicted nucleotidyltransferase